MGLEKYMEKFAPDSLWNTVWLRGFGLLKVPLILFVAPKVVHLDEEKCIIKVPLNMRTKNHLNCMYFGSLCVGADVTGGMMAVRLINIAGAKVAYIFKDMKVDFLKRAEGDVVMTCTDGPSVSQKVQEALTSGERVSFPVSVVATVPSKLGDEPVAKFVLTLSLKKRG